MIETLLVAPLLAQSAKLWLVGFQDTLRAWPEGQNSGYNASADGYVLTPAYGWVHSWEGTPRWAAISLKGAIDQPSKGPGHLKTGEWQVDLKWQDSDSIAKLDAVVCRSKWGDCTIALRDAKFHFRNKASWWTEYGTKMSPAHHHYTGDSVPGIAVAGPVLVFWFGDMRLSGYAVDFRTGKVRKITKIDRPVLTSGGVPCFSRWRGDEDHLPAWTDLIDIRGRTALSFKGAWEPGAVDLGNKTLWGRLLNKGGYGGGMLARADRGRVEFYGPLTARSTGTVVSRAWDLFLFAP